ncbi:unnamed protein product [Gongylonema pulchrum]|uniref:Uncharacterized protein n=1 Tax=Gongylonema pulchrum TaxID=637853 RepID=A0A183ED96_9BILA|nr:unnamed protein product [Gongylonema pulchrum]
MAGKSRVAQLTRTEFVDAQGASTPDFFVIGSLRSAVIYLSSVSLKREQQSLTSPSLCGMLCCDFLNPD